MFSLSDISRTQYVIFNIQDVDGTTGTIPQISSSSQPPMNNVDVSTIVERKENLLEALTADTLQESQQNLSLAEVYSVGYWLNYAQNRAQLPNATFLNDNGALITKGYVGKNAIKPLTNLI